MIRRVAPPRHPGWEQTAPQAASARPGLLGRGRHRIQGRASSPPTAAAMAFAADSSMPVTRRALIASGRSRLRPSLCSDASVLVQFGSFGKLRWDEAFGRRRLVSAFFVHRGLTTKDRLLTVLGQQCSDECPAPGDASAGGAHPPETSGLWAVAAPPLALSGAGTRAVPRTCCSGVAWSWVSSQLRAMGLCRGWALAVPGCREHWSSAVADWLGSAAMAGASAVVVKHARTNNALAVSFANAAHGDALRALLAAADAAGGPGRPGTAGADAAGADAAGADAADEDRDSDSGAGACPAKAAAREARPSLAEPRGSPREAPVSEWVLQRCFSDPALVGHGACPEGAGAVGRAGEGPVKFSIRANVLAVGRATVLVHSECLIHCATGAWRASDWGSAERHISNHSVQRSSAAYDAAVHTMTLQQLGAKMDGGELALWQFRPGTHATGAAGGDYQVGPVPWGCCGNGKGAPHVADGSSAASVPPIAARAEEAASEDEAEPSGAEQRLLGLVLEAVAALFARASATGFGTEWLPQPGCFELFGVDFLPEWEADKLCLRLLEVNEGPALGALAMPAACARVAEDTWRVVADPWLETARRCAAGGAPEASSAAASGKCAWAASLGESLRFGSKLAGSEWVVALALAPSREEPSPVFLPEGFLAHAAGRLQREGE